MRFYRSYHAVARRNVLESAHPFRLVSIDGIRGHESYNFIHTFIINFVIVLLSIHIVSIVKEFDLWRQGFLTNESFRLAPALGLGVVNSNLMSLLV